jgi:DNA polymerase-4
MVCGDPNGRSVVAAASYEARAFGVRAAMPVGEARRLCPHGEFVEGNPDRYLHYSHRLIELFRSVTPVVEPYSVDEAFLDVTGVRGIRTVHDAGALELSREVKRRIRTLCLGDDGGGVLTASVGIAPNKLVAKMASGLSKPDGLTVLDAEGFRRVFWPRPVTELFGIGEKIGHALAAVKIHTVRDLAHASTHVLRTAFGSVAPALIEMANGRDATPVTPTENAPAAKSIGHEYTLERNEKDPAAIRAHLTRLSQMVARRLRVAQMAGRIVTVRIRYPDFTTITRRHRFQHPTCDEARIAQEAWRLAESEVRGRAVRLLGVSVSDLIAEAESSGDLFATSVRARHINGILDAMRDRFGEDVITTGDVLALPSSTHVVIPPGDPSRLSPHAHASVAGVAPRSRRSR